MFSQHIQVRIAAHDPRRIHIQRAFGRCILMLCVCSPAALYAQSAIDTKYAQLGGSSGVLGAPTLNEGANQDGIGRSRTYQNGVIYWSPQTGAHEVHGRILDKWTALGREQGLLRYPTTDETAATDGVGRYNHFQGGSVFWSARTGTFEVHGKIREKYLALGNVGSPLGYPLSDELTAPDGVGRYNVFQTGSIYWTPATGAYEVHGAISGRWAQLGYERSYLGYPTSDEQIIPGYSGFGRYNRFQYGSIYYTSQSGAVDMRDPSTQWSSSLTPYKGTVPVLAILWDPGRPAPDQAPPASAIDSALFGQTNSVADWMRENTGGAVQIQKVATLGWYPANNPAAYYWTPDPNDSDGNGFVDRHVEKWAEAIAKANATVNFASFDRNGDGQLSFDELTVMIVIPSGGPGGFVRAPKAREVPTPADLIVDGVKIPQIVEWYTGAPSIGYPAHELSHVIFNAPDEYQTSEWRFAPGKYSIMDQSVTTAHYDPAVKLKAGIVNYQVAAGSGEYVLKAVETNREVLILADPARKDEGYRTREFFILENRWRGTSYDAGRGNLGLPIPQDGLAVWRVIDDPNLLRLIPEPTGAPDEWGRRGIQLFRADGGVGADDTKALFTAGMQISDTSQPARLSWADGSPTGFTITVLSPPGPEMRVRIDRR